MSRVGSHIIELTYIVSTVDKIWHSLHMCFWFSESIGEQRIKQVSLKQLH